MSIAASKSRLESSEDEVSAALPPSGRAIFFESDLELTAMLAQAAMSVRPQWIGILGQGMLNSSIGLQCSSSKKCTRRLQSQ